MLKRSLLTGAALLVLPCFAGADTVRPAVGKPLQQAEALMQRGNYNAALQQVNKAATVGSLTPYETRVVAQLRGAAAAGAGDYTEAAVAYQTVLASGAEPLATQTLLVQAIAGFYYQAQDYPHAVIWVNRYIAAHGPGCAHACLAGAGLLCARRLRPGRAGGVARAENGSGQWREIAGIRIAAARKCGAKIRRYCRLFFSTCSIAAG